MPLNSQHEFYQENINMKLQDFVKFYSCNVRRFNKNFLKGKDHACE
jgi:hypothetical protein